MALLRRILLAFVSACLLAALLSAQQFRFAIVGDRTGDPLDAVYLQTWREIDALRPDFVVAIGDMIQGQDDRTAGQQWEQLQRLLAPFRRYPVFFVAGNHDIWSSRSRKLFEQHTGRPASYGFLWQDALFVVLDNSQSDSLPEAELRFLESRLKAHPTCRPKFVFFHRPFWLALVKFKNRTFPLHRLARQYGVDFVVSGHLHLLQHLQLDGVHYVMLGSSGARIEPDFERGSFYQFAWVEVDSGSIRFLVRELSPPYGKARTVVLAP